MPKHIVTLLMAATLAGCLFASDAQARGGGGGHLGARNGAQVGDFHGMHTPSVDERRHGDHKFCHPDCGLYGCRYLWQYSCL